MVAFANLIQDIKKLHREFRWSFAFDSVMNYFSRGVLRWSCVRLLHSWRRVPFPLH